jgi:hypothetical protein
LAHPPADETEAGRALFQELLWVHGHIRSDLDVVRRLAVEVRDGLPADELHAELRSLKTNGPLWRLKVNCLNYCRFVHGHHNAEDVMFFPKVLRSSPDAAPVVERLEAEHRRVSDDLDAVEAAARALDDDRHRVVEALEALEANLLAHLDYEELNLGPAIRRMTGL